MKYARTQVYLDPEQHRSLREEARARGLSLAELMRRIVRQHLERKKEEPARPRDAYMKVVAIGSSGKRDVSERHDAYLGEALRDEGAR